MNMKSILEGRPELKAVIDQIAEVTGYLWQKGWAERNGGNITVNVTYHRQRHRVYGRRVQGHEGHLRRQADWIDPAPVER